MIEGRDQTDLFRQQHAIAEDIAGHVADTDNGEGFGLNVLAQLTEVALDRLPGAARGDAHLLVVITRRAARSEGIAEPEVEFVLGQSIGRIGEGRCALVGRDHEIGVFSIPGEGIGGTNDAIVDDIVGQIQQAPDEGLVGLTTGLEDLVARTASRQHFRIEAAL